MCFSYRWYGEKKTHNISMIQDDIFTPGDPYNDAYLVDKLWELFDEADIVVAHNAYKFDNKVATTAFLRQGLTPPSPYKTVDTLRVARSIARFSSNSLDSLCTYLGIGQKSKVKHADLWRDCLNGDPKAWKLMIKYNNQDVDLLYQLYEILLPYIKNHPNLGVILQKRDCCPKCASTDVQARGREGRVSGMVQRWFCNNCRGNFYSRVPDERLTKDEKPNTVN